MLPRLSLLLAVLFCSQGCASLLGVEEGKPEPSGGISGSSGQSGETGQGGAGQAGAAGAGPGGAAVQAGQGGGAGQAGPGGGQSGAGTGGAGQGGSSQGGAGQAGASAGGAGQGGAGGEGGAGGGGAGEDGAGSGGASAGQAGAGGEAGVGGQAAGGAAGVGGQAGASGGGASVGEGHKLSWYRQYGSQAEESLDAVVEDGEGGVVVAGRLGGPLALGGVGLSAGPSDTLFVARVSAAGEVQWAHTVAGKAMTVRGLVSGGGAVYLLGTGGGQVSFPDVAPEPGYDPPTAQGTKGGLLVRWGLDGKPAWARLYSGANPASVVLDSAVLDGARLLVAGTLVGKVAFDDAWTLSSQGAPAELNPDIVLLDVDAKTGKLAQARALPGAGSEDDPRLALAAGGYQVVGACDAPVDAVGVGLQPCEGLFWGQMDESLQFKQFKSYAFDQATGLRIAARPSGGAFVSGRYQGKAKLDAALPEAVGDFQGFVARLGAGGEPEKSVALGASGRVEPAALLLDGGGVLLGGWFRGQVVAPGGLAESSPDDQQNAFVLGLDASLSPALLWAYPGQGAGLLQAVSGLALGDGGALYVGASMKGGFSVAGEAKTSLGERDLVLMRYAP